MYWTYVKWAYITPATKCPKSINRIYIIENRLFCSNHYFFHESVGQVHILIPLHLCVIMIYILWRPSIKIFINSLALVVGNKGFHVVEQHDEKDQSPESPIRRQGVSWTTEAWDFLVINYHEFPQLLCSYNMCILYYKKKRQ